MPHRQARGENDRHGRLQRRVPLPASASQAGAVTGEQPGLGWTLALRRQPIRIVDGQPPGRYTDLYEPVPRRRGYHRLRKTRPAPSAAGHRPGRAARPRTLVSKTAQGSPPTARSPAGKVVLGYVRQQVAAIARYDP
jgi:hypothetical protein